MKIIQNANVIEIEHPEEIKITLDIYDQYKDYHNSTFNFRKLMSMSTFIAVYLLVTPILFKDIQNINQDLVLPLFGFGLLLGLGITNAFMMVTQFKHMRSYVSRNGVNKDLFYFLLDFSEHGERKFLKIYNYLLFASMQPKELLNTVHLVFDGEQEFEVRQQLTDYPIY